MVEQGDRRSKHKPLVARRSDAVCVTVMARDHAMRISPGVGIAEHRLQD
jgi:hypothetical protein